MLPRGLRNNNPGNINFANQTGAVLEPVSPTVPVPRFAKFDTMDDGIRALIFQLQLYFDRGIDTVTAIISKWAPPTENFTQNYIASVAASLEVSSTAVLEPTNDVLANLVMAISCMENGHDLPFDKNHVLTVMCVV